MKIALALTIIAVFFIFSLFFGFLLGVRSAFDLFIRDPKEFGKQAAIIMSKITPPKE